MTRFIYSCAHDSRCENHDYYYRPVLYKFSYRASTVKCVYFCIQLLFANGDISSHTHAAASSLARTLIIGKGRDHQVLFCLRMLLQKESIKLWVGGGVVVVRGHGLIAEPWDIYPRTPLTCQLFCRRLFIALTALWIEPKWERRGCLAATGWSLGSGARLSDELLEEGKAATFRGTSKPWSDPGWSGLYLGLVCLLLEHWLEMDESLYCVRLANWRV